MSRQLDPDTTREAILDASADLFTQSGYDGVSLSTVAREAKVTKSLIHHHFGSKQGLWEATKERMFAPYEAAQRAIIESGDIGGMEALRSTIELFFGALRNDEHMRRMMSWMSLNDELASMDMLKHITTEGIARITESQQNGDLRDDVSAHHLLNMILAASHSYFTFARCISCSGFVDETPEREQELYLDAMLKVLLKGFAPEATEEEEEDPGSKDS